MATLQELMARTMFDQTKRVEPEQRLVGGRFGWAYHRFPIKGGISPREVMEKNIAAHNPLLARLRSANLK